VEIHSQLKYNKMRIQKWFTFHILLAGILLIGIQGCKKYPENDGINLQTRTERVSNVWKIENYKLNGADLTSLLSSYSETFTKDKAYSYQWGIIGGTGSWDFKNNDAEIQITGISNQASRTLFILKLEETSFWYYYMDGTDKKEFHLIPQ
jgi:hypothetical protein